VAEDDETSGDFATPAMLRQGSLLVTISTGGSPALSALVRDRLASAIDPRWTKLAEAMQTLRPLIRQKLAPARRRELFRELCTEPAMNELDCGGIDALSVWIAARFPEMGG
jgi:precorrin-2 dehydrogenase/sirohydrochlorin ferrochelatase